MIDTFDLNCHKCFLTLSPILGVGENDLAYNRNAGMGSRGVEQ